MPATAPDIARHRQRFPNSHCRPDRFGTIDSPKLFFALTLRLERVQQARRSAWQAGDDAAHDRLIRRAFVLIGEILKISLP